MSARGKTHKKLGGSDISGNFLTGVNEQNNAFLKFLDNKTEDAFTRPWHRLERGLRLNRLRLFAKQEADAFNLDEKDQTALFALLTKSLDKKLLNSKITVVYDQEQQKILEIKGLVFHKLADGRVQFQFNERRTGVTLKKKRDDDESS
jgi:hypothetical protein